MRQITITAPEGTAGKISEIAFSSGVASVAVTAKRILGSDGSESVKDCVEIDVGTPVAKTFLDRLTSEPFFSRAEFSIAVRQPRALISREPLRSLTIPLVEPTIDIFEELWQFSRVTYGFVGRILIGGLLLAYGLADQKLLFMIAGLLFIPLLPLMLSVGFGLWTRHWRLAAQGIASFSVAMLLLVSAGIVVGLTTAPPVRYSEFNSMVTGLLVSSVVGIAGCLATADDVGRREMIGLAATAQVAIVPAWLGLCLILGFPLDVSPPSRPILGLSANVLAIIAASFLTYGLIRIKGSALTSFKSDA